MVAQKRQQSAKKANQDPPNAKGQSSTSKGREKGITIKEGAPQTKQTSIVEKVSQSKKDGKRKVGEPIETPPTTRQRTDSGGAVAMVLVSVSEISNTRLMIHTHPLFGLMIPFKKYTPFSSSSSASLLKNPM